MCVDVDETFRIHRLECHLILKRRRPSHQAPLLFVLLLLRVGFVISLLRRPSPLVRIRVGLVKEA